MMPIKSVEELLEERRQRERDFEGRLLASRAAETIYECPECKTDWPGEDILSELREVEACPDCALQCERCEGYDEVSKYSVGDEYYTICAHCK